MEGRTSALELSRPLAQKVERLIRLIEGRDPRTRTWLAEEPVRVAVSKLMFFTTPGQYRELGDPLRETLRDQFENADAQTRFRIFSFLVHWVDSLHSPVDLHHNLTRRERHGTDILSSDEVQAEQAATRSLAKELAGQAPEVERAFLEDRRNYAFSVNSAKGLNLFKAWAERWQREKDEDPFRSIDSYLDHRAALFARGNYYVEQYFARAEGRAITQFFNDYSEQADDCRKLGSLGGTTNPVIACMGEDDLPAKWAEARRRLAEQTVAEGRNAEWAATVFTELVVFNAQLAQRPVFLLEGLGRIAFQLRTDKAEDPDYLLAETPEIYNRLCQRLAVVDEILLEGADSLYQDLAKPRLGESNNHFKVSVSGPVALRILKEFNSGNNRRGVRLYTNSTVTHDLSQITAALDATMEGIALWEKKSGQRAVEDEGHFGAVVTSMMGRYVDAMRGRRIQMLLDVLGKDHSVYQRLSGKVSGKSPLNQPPLSEPEFVAAIREKGIDYRPDSEEDAIRNLPTLITKMAVIYAAGKYGPRRGNRILSASKRFFEMNTDLENEVRYATDFGDIQAQSIGQKYAPRPAPVATQPGAGRLPDGFDQTTGLPIEDPNNVWWQRMQELRRIFPDADRHLKRDGIPPEEWMNQPYNQATMNDFTSKWWLGVRRAEMCVALLQSQYRGPEGQREFTEKYFGHLKDKAPTKAWQWAQAFFAADEFATLRWKEPLEP